MIRIKKIIAPLLILTAPFCTVASPMLDSAGKFVVRVVTSVGTVGAGAVYAAEKYPRAVERVIAFKNAGTSTQAAIPIQQPIIIQQPAPSTSTDGLSNLISIASYMTKEKAVIGTLVASGTAIVYKYFNDKAFKNWIDGKIKTAKDETIDAITQLSEKTKAWFSKLQQGQEALQQGQEALQQGQEALQQGLTNLANRLETQEQLNAARHAEVRAGFNELDNRLPNKPVKSFWERIGISS